MTNFLGIEIVGGKCSPIFVAIMEDRGTFNIDKQSLQVRIRNLKRSGADTTEEEKALSVLNEEHENGNV